MSFSTHLESVVNQVDGALGCSIMGFDGMAVETHQKPDAESFELGSVWAEFSNLLAQAKTATEALKTGQVQELSINAENVVAVLRMVSPEYFLALALRPEGNTGKGRYVLRVTAPKIKAEL